MFIWALEIESSQQIFVKWFWYSLTLLCPKPLQGRDGSHKGWNNLLKEGSESLKNNSLRNIDFFSIEPSKLEKAFGHFVSQSFTARELSKATTLWGHVAM